MENDRYHKIINYVCQYNNISNEELVDILKHKECRYMLFLLLRRYGCDDKELLKELLKIENKRKLSETYRKAEEKFFVNRAFRDKYLEMEKNAQKII